MTVYAPAEHQPKLGRRREELTEVRLSVSWALSILLCLVFNIISTAICGQYGDQIGLAWFQTRVEIDSTVQFCVVIIVFLTSNKL